MNAILSVGGELSERKRIQWEIQLFALIRKFSDGITFFNFKINLNRYKDEHSPAFEIEFTFLNFYSHFWIYQNNYGRIEPIDVVSPGEYREMCQNLGYEKQQDEDELDNLATDYLNQGVPPHLCYKLAYEDLLKSKEKKSLSNL